MDSSISSGFTTSVVPRSGALGFLGGGGFIEETSPMAEDSMLSETDGVSGSGFGSRVGFRGGGGSIADVVMMVADERIQKLGQRKIDDQ